MRHLPVGAIARVTAKVRATGFRFVRVARAPDRATVAEVGRVLVVAEGPADHAVGEVPVHSNLASRDVAHSQEAVGDGPGRKHRPWRVRQADKARGARGSASACRRPAWCLARSRRPRWQPPPQRARGLARTSTRLQGLVTDSADIVVFKIAGVANAERLTPGSRQSGCQRSASPGSRRRRPSRVIPTVTVPSVARCGSHLPRLGTHVHERPPGPTNLRRAGPMSHRLRQCLAAMLAPRHVRRCRIDNHAHHPVLRVDRSHNGQAVRRAGGSRSWSLTALG